MLRTTIVGAAVTALGLVLAAPAAASEDAYLRELQARYTFLTAEQLLAEGERVCAATDVGVLSPDAANMVIDDLGVSVGPAMDIVSGAVLDLC